MPRQRNKVGRDADRRTQRALVLQLLRDDHDESWPRSELDAELGDIERPAIARALESLQEAGVVELEGDALSASPSAWRLQELALIGV
jgi:DNA-binding transcriptional ArsR family regulator